MVQDRLLHRAIIAIDLYDQQFIPFLEPIVSQLNSDRDFVLYAGTQFHNGQTLLRDVQEFSDLGIEAHRIFPIDVAFALRPIDVFLSAHLHGEGPKTSVRINSSHGMPVKWHLPTREGLERFEHYLVANDLHRRQIEESVRAYGLGASRIAVHPVGYPKLDRAFQQSMTDESANNSLGFTDAQRPVVLYAPSWEPGLSLRSCGVDLVRALADRGDCNIAIKLHPGSVAPLEHRDFEFLTGGVLWRDEFQVFAEEPNVRILEQNDTTEILTTAGLMVTDLSSSALEMLALDKPVAYFASDEFFDRYAYDLYSAYGNDRFTPEELRTHPGINAGMTRERCFRTVGELNALVDAWLEGSYPPIPAELAELYSVFNPGVAGQAAADVIGQLLSSSST